MAVGKVYRAYLQSAEWRERRDEALRAGGYRCALCRSTERLRVHHRTYVRLGCELPEDLTVLCFGCHRTFHAGGRPNDRAEFRRRIDEMILAALELYGAMTWDELRRQLCRPDDRKAVVRAQAWSRARRLLKQRRIVWTRSGKRLCLAGKRDLYDW